MTPGMGSKTHGDDWIGHQDAFEDLLAQLNAQKQDGDDPGMYHFWWVANVLW